MKTLASSVCLLMVTACGINANVLSDAGISTTGGGTGTSTSGAGGSSSSAAGGTTANSQTCDDLEQTAKSAFNSFVAANQNCTTDADCSTVDVDHCLNPCLAVANRVSATDVTAYSKQLCSTLSAQGCPLTVDALCIAYHAICTSGTCEPSVGDGGASGVVGAGGTGGTGGIGTSGGAGTSMTGAGGSSSSASGGTTANSQACQDLQQTAQTAFNGFVAAHQNCTTDTDCATAGSISPCVFPCLNLMNTVSTANAVAYSTQLCSDFFAQGCSPYQVMCPAGPTTCNSGTCAYSWGAGGSSGVGGGTGTGG